MASLSTTTMPVFLTNRSCVGSENGCPVKSTAEQHVVKIVIFTTVVVLILTIVVGNGIMVASIVKFKKLRTVQNIFLASLAMSDLLLGILVLPLSLMRELLKSWPIGRVVCKVYLATDIFLCTASIWNLCIISINRYWAITHGVKYRGSKRTRRAVMMVVLAWVWSAVVCIPPFIFSNAFMAETECHHSSELWYILFSVSGSFYIPLFIMVVTYGKIMHILWKQARNGNVLSVAMRRQKRLNFMIGIILSVFVICWFPFFQAYVTQALCSTCFVPPKLFKFLEWFAYCNSAMNPLIYNLNNARLSKAFWKILRVGRKSRIKNALNGRAAENAKNNDAIDDLDESHSSENEDNNKPVAGISLKQLWKASDPRSRRASVPPTNLQQSNVGIQEAKRSDKDRRRSIQYNKFSVMKMKELNGFPSICWVEGRNNFTNLTKPPIQLSASLGQKYLNPSIEKTELKMSPDEFNVPGTANE